MTNCILLYSTFTKFLHKDIFTYHIVTYLYLSWLFLSFPNLSQLISLYPMLTYCYSSWLTLFCFTWSYLLLFIMTYLVLQKSVTVLSCPSHHSLKLGLGCHFLKLLIITYLDFSWLGLWLLIVIDLIFFYLLLYWHSVGSLLGTPS